MKVARPAVQLCWPYRYGWRCLSPRLCERYAPLLGHDVIDCGGTGFVRFNDDSRCSWLHLVLERSHAEGLENRHPAIVDRSEGSAEERSHRRERCAADQADQPANYSADLGSMKKVGFELKNRHLSLVVFGHDDTRFQFEICTAVFFRSFIALAALQAALTLLNVATKKALGRSCTCFLRGEMSNVNSNQLKVCSDSASLRQRCHVRAPIHNPLR